MSERIPQYLLKRNPALTKEEFAAAWRHHAELVTPYFLSGKISYYAQIRSPLRGGKEEADGNLSLWDGAAELVQPLTETELSDKDTAWRSKYYRDIILPDEKRFLISEAVQHLKVTEGVEGDRVVIMKDGKSLIEVSENVLKVWEEYKRIGQAE